MSQHTNCHLCRGSLRVVRPTKSTKRIIAVLSAYRAAGTAPDVNEKNYAEHPCPLCCSSAYGQWVVDHPEEARKIEQASQ